MINIARICLEIYFFRADEYLYAMKEDLAEWLNNLYPHLDMDAENFFKRLETGENLILVSVPFYKKQHFLFTIFFAKLPSV